MRQDLYYRLRKYENYLLTAIEADYIRTMTVSQVKDIEDISDGLGVPYHHNGCPKCLFTHMKKLATLYFDEVKRKQNKKPK